MNQSLVCSSFPTKYENTFIPIAPNTCSLSNQATTSEGLVSNKGKDDRVRVASKMYGNITTQMQLNSIGILRVLFAFNNQNDEPPPYGTAVIVKTGKRYLYLLTAAHNILHWNSTEQAFDRPTKIWFELRQNNYFLNFWNKSSRTKRFVVEEFKVHSEYLKRDNPQSDCGYDIAVLRCGNLLHLNQRIITQSWYNNECHKIKTLTKLEAVTETLLQIHANKQLGCKFIFASKTDHRATIIGFPGEYNGEMYGANGLLVESKNKNLWTYKIDTTRGQSGSPIFQQKVFQEKHFNTKIPFVSLSKIIGIHTGTDHLRNHGTKITKSIFIWILQMIYEMNLTTYMNRQSVWTVINEYVFGCVHFDQKTSVLNFMNTKWIIDSAKIMKNIPETNRADLRARYIYCKKNLISLSRKKQ
eukprot:144624_1